MASRKAAYYTTQTQSRSDPAPKMAKPIVINHRHMDQTCINTIEEIEGHAICPCKYRLKARIVDYHPFDIKDFTLRRCKNCKSA